MKKVLLKLLIERGVQADPNASEEQLFAELRLALDREPPALTHLFFRCKIQEALSLIR